MGFEPRGKEGEVLADEFSPPTKKLRRMSDLPKNLSLVANL